jgi:hypothetical protein
VKKYIKEVKMFSQVDDFLKELPKMVEPELPKGKYSVWVGGCEIAENVTEEVAEAIKDSWIEKGYDDVEIQTPRLTKNISGTEQCTEG